MLPGWPAAGATTKRKFQDFTLHVEFMICYMPETQTIYQRPNSGVYLQQRYEIQILDSFGVVMGQHDCGVLYAQITPAINMCYPPLTWQTYDYYLNPGAALAQVHPWRPWRSRFTEWTPVEIVRIGPAISAKLLRFDPATAEFSDR